MHAVAKSFYRGSMATMKNNLLRTFATSSTCSKYNFETLLLSQPSEFVFHVEINRPEKANCLNEICWREIGDCFKSLALDEDCRAIVLTGKGKYFSAGIDLECLFEIGGTLQSDDDIAKKCKKTKEKITFYQNCFTSLEACLKPVIVAVHSGCIGAGVDMISAADIRYASSDAWFQIKEIDLGLAADVGTLQRFPKIIGNQSLVRELAFTGRKFSAEEALKMGFVSQIFNDKESVVHGALNLAKTIATKSPVAMQATKEAIIHARDNSVADSLNYLATMNMAYLQSEDVKKAAMAMMQKEKPTFSKL